MTHRFRQRVGQIVGHPFRAMTVRAKIIAGYLTVLAVIALACGGVILRMGEIGRTVTELTDNLAAEQRLADRIMSRVWRTRFFAQRHIDDPTSENIARFNNELAAFDQLLQSAAALVDVDRRAPMLRRIAASLGEYQGRFYAAADLIGERSIIIGGSVDLRAALLDVQLAQLADRCLAMASIDPLHRLFEIQRLFLSIRVNSFRYLMTGDPKWVSQRRYHQARGQLLMLEKEFRSTAGSAAPPSLGDLTAAAAGTLEKFIRGMDRLEENDQRLRRLLITELAESGAAIEAAAEAISRSVADDFGRAKAETQDQLARSRAGFFLLLILAIGMGAGLGLLISRGITRPITAMMEGVSRVAGGRYDRRVPILTEDEIGRLGMAFNQMTDAIVAGTGALKERSDQLAAANQELREFAYVVSHDLKAPLRGISQLAGWLVEDHADALPAEAAELCQMIVGRARRMDLLIDGVLQYSRLGRTPERPSRVALSRLIPEAIAMLSPPPHIRIEAAPDPPEIVADPTRLAQVFQNLLGNAVKFMDKPEGSIRVEWAPAGDFWEFSISDNGPGIDPKYHEKIFQIFQTLHARDERESTGIGLTLVKKIITLYGGTIRVESTPGEGTIFRFTLPRSGQPTELTQSANPAGLTQSADPVELTKSADPVELTKSADPATLAQNDGKTALNQDSQDAQG